MPDRPVAEAGGIFYLWPDNLASFAIFRSLQTQWVEGADGRAIGLNYTAVLDHLERGLRVPYRKRPEIYADIRTMEQGALQGFRERAAERERNPT